MIRKGFVSNSSSSSFIIKKKDESTIMHTPQEIIDNLDKYNRIVVIGRELSDGDDIFTIDEGLKTLIRSYKDRFLANAEIQMAIGDPIEYRDISWDEIEDKSTEDAEDIYPKDYCSIGNEVYDDIEYGFVKNYLLTPEEWKTVYDFEWGNSDLDTNPKMIMASYLYEKEYTIKDLPNLQGKNITLVINTFLSKFIPFIPILYINVKEGMNVDFSKLRSDVQVFENFRWVNLEEEQEPVNFKFKFKGIFGIGNETKDIKLFYKKEDEEDEF